MGDVPGAIQAMEAARDIAGTPADAAWASYQLGSCTSISGDLAAAHARVRARRRTTDADYVPPLAGLAKVAWARGRPQRGDRRDYTDVVARYPRPST